MWNFRLSLVQLAIARRLAAWLLYQDFLFDGELDTLSFLPEIIGIPRQ